MEETAEPEAPFSLKMALLLLLFFMAVLIGLGNYQDGQREQRHQACIDKYGDSAAYSYSGETCVDISAHKDRILELLENNQPMTITSITQSTELDRYEAQVVLNELAKQGLIYSYDRGWSEDGWKTLEGDK